MTADQMLARIEWERTWGGDRCVDCAAPCAGGDCGAGRPGQTPSDHASESHSCESCGRYTCGACTGDGGLCAECAAPELDDDEADAVARS